MFSCADLFNQVTPRIGLDQHVYALLKPSHAWRRYSGTYVCPGTLLLSTWISPTDASTASELLEHLYSSLADRSTAAKLEALSRLHLLIIDELGYMPIDKLGANLFFQLVSRQYETGSIILTTNLPFDQWDTIFGDSIISAAIIDRLAHHCHILNITGNSYRVKDKLKPKPRDSK